MAKKLTSQQDDYPQWYQDVIEQADLAEHSLVRGSMVIKPYGYALWEQIQSTLDRMIKETGHENAYFPLLIPKSLLSKEADHVKGFAKECAIVTHYRLKESEDGKSIEVDPKAKLEEEYIIRPTSETVMYETYSRWIESYRDLPVMINQWANVMRWEMRTRFFLRTTEFLWQEGHTAHATEEEAEAESRKMLDVYKTLAVDYFAMPVIPGEKTENERFPGADHTYTIEAMMKDGKALQSDNTHNLGQNFAKAFDIQYSDKDGKRKYVWQTSWGVSTRLIGGIIMTHGDDKGLVLPPMIAPIQVVLVPIWKKDDQKEMVFAKANELIESLKKKNIRVKLDDRDYQTPGEKFFEWEKKGIPVRLELGPRDIESNIVIAKIRHNDQKHEIAMEELAKKLPSMLKEIQKDMLKKSTDFREEHTTLIDSYDEFKQHIKSKGGFVKAYWAGSNDDEEQIAKETKASIRCIPFEQPKKSGKCFLTGKETDKMVIFAKAY